MSHLTSGRWRASACRRSRIRWSLGHWFVASRLGLLRNMQKVVFQVKNTRVIKPILMLSVARRTSELRTTRVAKLIEAHPTYEKSVVTKLSIPTPTSGDPLRRQRKSCILERFSTPHIKPFRRHWSVEQYSILSHLKQTTLRDPPRAKRTYTTATAATRTGTNATTARTRGIFLK